MGVCNASKCIDNAYRNDYCDHHEKLRVQHASSHLIDGHSKERIEMCPSSETVKFQKDRIEDILG